MDIPTLHTGRLVLRPFTLEDAPVLQRLAGHREVASTTLAIPHPYEDGMAEAWIGTQEAKWAEREQFTLAVTGDDEGLVGGIGLRLQRDHRTAELGYWIGVPFWGRGYATEAGRAVIAYGFTTLDLHRIEAHCFARNPASGKVLEKLGMRREGILRENILKWGVREDSILYGVLASEWKHSITA